MRMLKGDVDVLGLGTLLQGLAMRGCEGVLTVVRGTNRKMIHLGPKGMKLHSTSMQRINKVGNILLRRKKLSTEDLKTLLEEQRLLHWKFGHLAVDSGKVTPAALVPGVVAVRGWPPAGSTELAPGERYFAGENRDLLPASNQGLRRLRATCTDDSDTAASSRASRRPPRTTAP